MYGFRNNEKYAHFSSLQEVCNILFTVRIITIIPCVNVMLITTKGGTQLLNQSKSYCRVVFAQVALREI